MRRLLCAVVAGSVAFQPLAVAGQDAALSRGEWRRVTRLDPGKELQVSAGSLDRAVRRFVRADDRELIVLDLSSPTLSDRARRDLLALARDHATSITTDASSTFEHVKIGPDGVFVRGERVGDRGAIIQQIAREDVVEVASIPRRGGSGLATALGIAVGVLGGLYGGAVLSFAGHETLAVLALLGLPVAGGMIGAKGTGRVRQEIYYRRPIVPSPRQSGDSAVR
jgi:hypothetical protein